MNFHVLLHIGEKLLALTHASGPQDSARRTWDVCLELRAREYWVIASTPKGHKEATPLPEGLCAAFP